MVLAVVLPWLLIAFGCWLCHQLVRQNGRILLRLEVIERSLKLPGGAEQDVEPSLPTGLPIGSPAPAFELPDLTGTRRELSQFRGRRLLLIFFHPGCHFCLQMLPSLAALPTDGAAGSPMPLVISTGSIGETQTVMDKHGVRASVLLQQETNVAATYK